MRILSWFRRRPEAANRTLRVSSLDLDYDHVYKGPIDPSDFDGDILLAPGMGTVFFRGSVHAHGSVRAYDGTGIDVHGSLVVDGDLTVSLGVRAGEEIRVGGKILAGNGVVAGRDVTAGDSLCVATSVLAGFSFEPQHQRNANAVVRCLRLEGGTVAHGRLIETTG